MEVYAAMIDRMDQNIGRLLDQLQINGQLKNTVIFFLSDNGGCKAGNLAVGKYANPRFRPDAFPGGPESFTGYGQNWANVSNTPFREFKTDIHEGGIATPFIAWYPERFPSGRINHSVTHLVDLMPTLLELADTEYPVEFNGNKIKPKEGESLVQTITNQVILPERTLYFEHLGRCGVIEGDWKIVRYRDMPWELYNLFNDRSETENLAEKYPDKCQDMITKYETWATKNKVLPREEVEKAMIYKF
jgi:arylsulfatase